MILDEFFKFPYVTVDGDNEQAKKNLFGGSSGEPPLDIIIGEAEYPYFALIGISDKWMPDTESFQNALEHREFNACVVTFANIGQLLVPWNKEKFKKEYKKFVTGIKPNKPQMQLITLTEEQVKQIEEDERRSRDNEG